ncbi:hypothetical protein H6P81_019725 [Aristolochia fimbriata]|uniref:Gag-pol polyprotein n=1 Tax=Aristolochia fimbriata TaxID=158543 RepID=A0AAV7DSI9_ARIFI|nr:hypothetical protein H6P81_019725 [Aristolochia fimbriata]
MKEPDGLLKMDGHLQHLKFEKELIKRVLKSCSDWNDEEDRLSNCNSKALNAIFGGIDEEQFMRVSACTTAKEAWKILEMLMTQFELMRMRDDETILEFEGKIRDIENQSANLGDRIPQDLSKKVRENKRESIAFQTLTSNEVTQSTQEYDNSTITLTKLDAKVSLLAKGFNKFIRKNKKKNYSSGEGKQSGVSFDSANKSKVIKCYECGGRGHIQSECPTYLRKKKSLVAAWSDDSSTSEDDEYDEDDTGTVENIIKQWDEVLESTKVLREQVGALEREKVVLNEENHMLKQQANEKEERILKMEEELRKAKEIWVKFDKGKEQLDGILTQEKRRGNKHGLGYRGASSSLQPVYTQPRHKWIRKFIPTCHYCGFFGHIRPYCYKLQRFWRKNGKCKGVKSTTQNLVWVKKEIGSTEFLTNLHKENGGQVTFRDGAKGSVVEKGDLNVQGLPKLTNLLLVEGLKANSISISQLCDQNLYVNFTRDGCQCQYTRENTAQLWHKRLRHIHARGLYKLIKYGAVRGLPTLIGTVETVCKGCMEVQTESIAGKKYVMVCVDDFTRFTWVEFLREKSEAFKLFVNLCKQLMTEKGVTIGRVVRIRSDHGNEFENQDFANFCESKGISHEFSAPKTPQQNGIVERKNKTLQEMARTMINEKELPHKLWAKAVNTTCYVSNRVHLRYLTRKTPYELDREQLRKFDSRSTKGIFVGYSRNSHAYRVFLKSASMVIETVNVEVADQNGGFQILDDEQVHVPLTDTPHDTLEELSVKDSPEDTGVSYTEIQEGVAAREKAPSIRVQKNHPADAIIGDINEGMKTRGKKKNYGDMVRFVCYTSLVEPRKVEEALKDEFWIKAMQEELEQFERNEVWTLVPHPENLNVIGTKSVLMNKTDEEGNVIRNKARLVVQGYTQVEEIDFDETFAPVARLESIRLLLATASMMKIKLQQMDVKSVFLNGYLNEEVYVEQPKGFEDPHRPDYKTLFINKRDHEITLTQIYVDDIIFGSTSDCAKEQFVKYMQEEFEMSMEGELAYFLGFQIKQRVDGIFISQEKYARNLVKKFGLEDAKAMRTPMSTTDRIYRDKNGTPAEPTLYRSMIGSLLYLTASRPDLCYSVGLCARFQSAPKESHVKTVKRIIRYVKNTVNLGVWYAVNTSNVLAGYSDADWAGDTDDRKNTSGGCFYLGTNLVSWYNKKQNSISLSTTEAEYIAAGSCCAQLLWMKQMLADYGIPNGVLTVYYDNTSAINISKNPVQHSRMKQHEMSEASE